jgi:hypothetical protein
MAKGLISIEAATKEVNDWLDYQDITLEHRTGAFKGSVDKMVQAISSGNLIINPDKSLKQTLKHPIGSDAKVSEINYKASLIVADLTNAEDSKDESEIAGALKYLRALTGEINGVIEKINDKDFRLCQAIVNFFML